MNNRETLEILQDVATFAISARENGVDLNYTFYGDSLTMTVFKGREVDSKLNLWLFRETLEESKLKMAEFMTDAVEKYYHV